MLSYAKPFYDMFSRKTRNSFQTTALLCTTVAKLRHFSQKIGTKSGSDLAYRINEHMFFLAFKARERKSGGLPCILRVNHSRGPGSAAGSCR